MTTLFLDLRAIPSGGVVAGEVGIIEGADDGGSGRRLTIKEFRDAIQGRHVLLATHGFNVNRKSGIAGLTKWNALSQLQGLERPVMFVGVLWPGDSTILPILDYPMEGSIANESGKLLAGFIDSCMSVAPRISLASHSLGARTVLETIKRSRRRFAQLILMAGAIEDDCLTAEYADAAARIDAITIVASREDMVLALAFPIGNLVGDFIRDDHPFFSRAVGREGVRTGDGIDAFLQQWQLPGDWDYGHLDYMPDDLVPPFAAPLTMPVDGDPVPRPDDKGWKPAWSAAVIATELGRD